MTPIVSLFNVSPSEVAATPGLAEQLRAAGVTHLRMCARYEREHLVLCKDQGFRALLWGDNFLRYKSLQELNCNPYEVGLSATMARESGICDGVDMVDEIGQEPGAYPIIQFAEWWYGAGGPPLGFPGYKVDKYESLKLPSDGSYVARRICRQWNHSLAETYKTREAMLVGALSDLPQDDRRVQVLIPVTGPWYSKRVEGDHWQKGKDVIHNRGIQPAGVELLVKRAAQIVGKDRLDLSFYGYDSWAWKSLRAAPAVSGRRLQTGVTPGSKVWEAMARAIRGVAQ